jgi:hypothetical protein
LFCLRFYCFFIDFVLCLVCPMLPVSLLFCLRFIVFSLTSPCVVCAQCCQCKKTINLRQKRRDTGNIVHTRHRTKSIKKPINLRQNRRDNCRVCPMLPVSLLFCLRFYCFFIDFVLSLVCPMLPVSLLFCIKKPINLRQNRRDNGNIGYTRHRTKTIKKQ